MPTENSSTEPENDYSGWVASPAPSAVPKRWCPTHRRYEACERGKRLQCAPAWAELYKMEKEVQAGMVNPNIALMNLAENIGDLVEEMRNGGVIAEPPTLPQRPRPPLPPPPAPPPPRHNGKGGVALP